ncbi:MAG: lytic transglycosylase domain-containing protein [Bacteroidales bacterium]|nr:lytic transglycosylase domain-containing protein [Bacteroidales bacterium]
MMYISRIVSISFIIITLSSFSVSAVNRAMPNDSSVNVVDRISNVISPQIPDYVLFCGDTIRLKRYDMYERFDREMMAMMFMHSSTLQMLKKANRYFPMMAPILAQMGLPDDLKYLSVIESSLNVRAVSPAKAAGLWQLMPATGRMYGLEVNDTIDERYHVELSTVAAGKMLKDLYARFKNWSSVSAAYNIGPGRISTELKNQSAESSLDLWLVEETSRYVFRILAAKELFEHPRKYGFVVNQKQLYKSIRSNDVIVNGPIDDLYQFATDNGTTYFLLKDFNAWLRGKSIPNSMGKIYKIKVPFKEDIYYNSDAVTSKKINPME